MLLLMLLFVMCSCGTDRLAASVSHSDCTDLASSLLRCLCQPLRP